VIHAILTRVDAILTRVDDILTRIDAILTRIDAFLTRINAFLLTRSHALLRLTNTNSTLFLGIKKHSTEFIANTPNAAPRSPTIELTSF